MTDSGYARLATLLRFLEELSAFSVHYHLSTIRSNAIMVEIATPGFRWEVEFFSDGTIETERFDSQGVKAGFDTLDEVRQAII